MGKRVLVAVDPSDSEAPIRYGIQLAARIKSSLMVIVVSSSKTKKRSGPLQVSPHDLHKGRHVWLNQAVAESQRKGIGLEIFVASGRFIDEVLRFVRSQSGVQFIVMPASREREGKDSAKSESALKHLTREFEGEILLVEKAGDMTRVSDLYLENSARENSV